ncbi:TorD/DmsD family molecular chaperone [Achromobacter aloeverae]
MRAGAALTDAAFPAGNGQAECDAAIFEACAQLLTWLARFFQGPPPARFIESLGAAPGHKLVMDIASSIDDPETGEAMLAALSAEHAALAASRAYTQLFEGVSGPRGVSLYESAYVGSGRLFGEPCAEMQRLLGACGRSLAVECREPPDHLGVEILLLADRLAQRDWSAAVQLADRLARWAPDVAQACARHDASHLYAAAARLLLGALRHTRAALEIFLRIEHEQIQ